MPRKKKKKNNDQSISLNLRIGSAAGRSAQKMNFGRKQGWVKNGMLGWFMDDDNP